MIFKRFLQARDGATAIEFAFLIPILIVLLTASVIIFLMFQGSKLSERATFTVSDVVSRRTTVDSTFLNSTYQLFLRMANRSADDVKFRVTSLTKKDGTFTIAWSYAVAPQVALASTSTVADKLPLVSDGDSIVLVETVVKVPSLTSFLPITVPDYTNAEIVRPRFTSAIAKTD